MPPNDPVRIIAFDEEQAAPGLDGVVDSLAYRVSEIENHLHSWDRWFGLAAAPVGETHRADRVGPGIAPFVLTAGNDNWGNWVQLLGSNDTPAVSGMARFDFNQIVVSSVSNDGRYFIQIAIGETAAGALAANTYTELVLVRTFIISGISPSQTRVRRADSGSKVWARVMSPGNNAYTLSLHFGIHEYEG